MIAASPADVQRYSRDFGDYLRIPLRTRRAMQRNLETRLGARLEDLHIPTFAPGILVPTLVIHDRGGRRGALLTRGSAGPRLSSRAADPHAGARASRGAGAIRRWCGKWSRSWGMDRDRHGPGEPDGARFFPRALDDERSRRARRVPERGGGAASGASLGRRWPHLDLKLEPRDRALAHPGVRVFERTAEMLRYLKSTGLNMEKGRAGRR